MTKVYHTGKLQPIASILVTLALRPKYRSYQSIARSRKIARRDAKLFK